MLISLFILSEIAINLDAWLLFLVQPLYIIHKQRYTHWLEETKKG